MILSACVYICTCARVYMCVYVRVCACVHICMHLHTSEFKCPRECHTQQTIKLGALI